MREKGSRGEPGVAEKATPGSSPSNACVERLYRAILLCSAPSSTIVAVIALN